MDYLCRPFGGNSKFIETLLRLIDEPLKQDSNWLSKESSILALGCVSIGQTSQIEKYLPSIISFLFDQVGHPQPLVRSVCCWTLSRYSRWILEQVRIPFSPGFFFCVVVVTKAVLKGE